MIIKPLLLSQPDMGGFTPFLPQKKITEIDAKPQHATSKFADGVQELLSVRGFAWEHVHAAFAFQIPGLVYLSMTNFGRLSLTGIPDGGNIRGIASAPLVTWLEFIAWLDVQDGLAPLREALLSHLSRFELFRSVPHRGIAIR